MTLEKLKDPPIVEVVCGVIFEPLPNLDPLAAGAYWTQRRAEFPQHEMRPAVTEGSVVLGLVPPLRSLLFHQSGTRVLQLQSDRFYVNWRRRDAETIAGARGGEYPRFSDRTAKPGLISSVLTEYAGFEDFCSEFLGIKPNAVRIELAKVDMLIEGLDWHDFDELAALLPWLKSFTGFARSNHPSFALQFDEPRKDSGLSVTISQSVAVDGKGAPRRLVKLETRLVKAVGRATMRETFLAANAELNAVFEELIPVEERAKRFGSEG